MIPYYFSIYPNINIVYFVNCREGAVVDANKTTENHEADSVPDTPLTEAEGKHLLAMIRGCEPEDFELEGGRL